MVTSVLRLMPMFIVRDPSYFIADPGEMQLSRSDIARGIRAFRAMTMAAGPALNEEMRHRR
ncbi:hypothetical protein AZH53_04020 [Methanomicrobiaceae archaeon CYW5]|nr:hypothetical protein [Methanovulcanius yangii]